MFDFERSEFTSGALPRAGLTSVEAERLLREAVPEVAQWTFWMPEDDSIGRLVPQALAGKGRVGPWNWTRRPVPYPTIWYVISEAEPDGSAPCWTGLLQVSGPDGADFLLFSFLNSEGQVGKRFMVSTTDPAVLGRFLTDVREHRRLTRGAERLIVEVASAPDFEVATAEEEQICLPRRFQEDIERQVMTFFRSRAAYTRMGIPYRRGLLFAGPPGCGKTLMVRRLMRATWREFRLRYWSLPSMASMSDRDVLMLFRRAREAAPGMIVMEDLDGIARNPRISRSTLLAQLDGLVPQQGLLVLATTNHPEDIDPALAHRPSRFDRIWRFDLPDEAMRLTYLETLLPDASRECLRRQAAATPGWSYAYLKELRASAAILALQDGRETVVESDLNHVMELLSAQFEAGRKNHVARVFSSDLGFGMVK